MVMMLTLYTPVQLHCTHRHSHHRSWHWLMVHRSQPCPNIIMTATHAAVQLWLLAAWAGAILGVATGTVQAVWAQTGLTRVGE